MEPQRLAAAPFIPAALDPEIEAARAAAASASDSASFFRDAAPSWSQRLVAMAIDLLMIGLLATVASGTNAALPVVAVLLFGWVIIRFLPLVLLGQTPGHTLAGYEIRGPRGARLAPARAASRDALVFAGIAWLLWGMAPGANVARNELDRRWPHDLLADSWPIRREALVAAQAGAGPAAGPPADPRGLPGTRRSLRRR